jgi:hypothetical protein
MPHLYGLMTIQGAGDVPVFADKVFAMSAGPIDSEGTVFHVRAVNPMLDLDDTVFHIRAVNSASDSDGKVIHVRTMEPLPDSNDTVLKVRTMSPVPNSDDKVVHVRMVSPFPLQDCIDLLSLATAFGWQPFQMDGYFHADVVSLEEALERAKAAAMTDYPERHEKLRIGMVPGYPVPGIDPLGLRGALLDYYLDVWERDELIKLIDELIRADRARLEE